MATVEQALARLQRSAFRAKFHLSEQDRQYIADKGMETIQHHAADFIRMRLAPANIPNDGKQTPMRGHPVFIAQHACACCCRGCLHKWYHVPVGRELTENEQERIVKLLMAWIARQLDCDTVILSVGFREDRGVFDAWETSAREIYLLGDAKKVANIMYAVWDAFEVANHI